MGALEVKTTETMNKQLVVIIMFERADDEMGSFQINCLHVHIFKGKCDFGFNMLSFFAIAISLHSFNESF